MLKYEKRDGKYYLEDDMCHEVWEIGPKVAICYIVQDGTYIMLKHGHIDIVSKFFDEIRLMYKKMGLFILSKNVRYVEYEPDVKELNVHLTMMYHMSMYVHNIEVKNVK